MTKEPTLAHRLVLYPIVAAFFTIVAAFIVYSALGYDISYKEGKLQFNKTGLIVLSTRPGDARVYIDEKLYRKKTPSFSLFTLKIAKVSPGSHVIRLEKDGYQSWQGKFDVESGLVSWGNFVLFVPLEKKTQAYNFSGKITQIITSKDKTKQLLLTDDAESGAVSFWEVNTENKEKRRVFETKKLTGESYKLLGYSTGEERILFEKIVQDKKSYHVMESKENGTSWNISDLFGISMERLEFNPKNHNELYALRQGNLYSLDYFDKKLSAILESNVVSVYPEEGGFLFVQEVEKNYGLYRFETNGTKTNLVKSLPFSDSYQIQTLPEVKQIAILSNKDKDLYLYSEHAGKSSLKRVSQNVNYFVASPHSRYIGFSKEDDFYTHDIEKEKTFETIRDKKITSLAWFSDEGNIIFSEEGKIYLVNYNGWYQTLLFNGEKEYPVITGPNTVNVFFVGKNELGTTDLLSFTFSL